MFIENFAEKITAEDGSVMYVPTGLGSFALVLIGIICLLLALSASRRLLRNRSAVRQLAFSAMAIALATVTSEIKLFPMPLGGSVTLCSMLFIALIGCWYGPSAGILTGIAHGVLQLLLDPKIYSLPQMLIDYPLAFGALGMSGLFWKAKKGLIKGYLTAAGGRFIFSFFSGLLFFAYYAPEGWHPAVYSAAYNICYIGGEALITALILLLPPVAAAMTAVKKLAQEQ